jgi:hypothetical protein
MKQKNKMVFRVLVLVTAWLMVSAIPVWAFQGVGGSPYAADLLISGLNTGALDPGQEYWYAYSRLDLGNPDYNSIILSLNFEAEGIAAANRVNFQVFTFKQVEGWLANSSGPIDSLGLGTPASADFDADTGERLWAGLVAPNEVYYVRIFNLSPSPVQFRLTALGQKNSNYEILLANQQPLAINEAIIPAAVNVPGQFAANTAGEADISNLPLAIDASSPASTRWLLAAQAIQGLSPQEAAAWLMSAAMLGWLPGGEGVSQPAAVPVDPNANTVASADAGGDDTEPEVVVVEAVDIKIRAELETFTGESIYPNRPVKLLEGPNVGRLAPQTEHWYTFTPGKLDDEVIENMSLTMFFTPGEPNLARHVTFELFTGSQYHIWERGTPQDMAHFGAGSWVSRDNDYMTGERLWHGTVVDGDQYFIKITNDTNQWMDYYLFPADIINTELGESIVKKVADDGQNIEIDPTGHDIGSPLVTNKGVNSGRLAAGQDIWFSFKTPNTNPTSFDFLPYSIELLHRPGATTNDVNVEIYPYQEQQIWRRGDTDKIKPLGIGSFTTFRQNQNSHTYMWDGHFVSNTIYFIRVKNDSSQQIDYDLIIRRK